ncbi:hypothetical protein FRC03_007714, partial [Tulasnella sp. 419]
MISAQRMRRPNRMSSDPPVDHERNQGTRGKHDAHVFSLEFGCDTKYWQQSFELAQDRYRELMDRWHDELNFILTSAGLFAGANIGFIVLCLGLLDKSPSDTTNSLLRILITHSTNVTMEELEK